MVKHVCLLICDSQVIAEYIHTEHARYHPRTMYIAYDADTHAAFSVDSTLEDWYGVYDLRALGFYSIVGRLDSLSLTQAHAPVMCAKQRISDAWWGNIVTAYEQSSFQAAKARGEQ